jgi:hypothetical protein
MTSLINPSNIDITYPVAGQDNDTQGFRTNFQNIRNNFVVAGNEITGVQSSVATLQTQVFGNANVAAYLPNYTGNISAGNLNVTSVTYTNQEIINTNDVITGNATVSGNLIVTSIVSPASSNGNITINPDGAGDVLFPLSTEVYIQSGASSTTPYRGALVITGGIGISGNINSGGNIFLSNTITVGNGVYSSGSFTGLYSDGTVVDYAPGNGRISVGAGDYLTFYAGGPGNTQTFAIASNAVVTLSSAIQFANLTTTQVNAISTPARGMTVYNYTTGNIQVYNGTKWANITLS